MWKPVTGYEEIYEVSRSGQIRSLGRYVNNNGTQVWREGKPISLSQIKSGYMVFSARKSNKRKTLYVHKCVAEAFIENPDNLKEVNHKDHNKKNNDVTNLEWVTHQENMVKSSEFYGTRVPDNFCSCGAKILTTSTKCKSVSSLVAE